jgi:hypothetical protein
MTVLEQRRKDIEEIQHWDTLQRVLAVYYLIVSCPQRRAQEKKETPYPWCHGNPAKQDCIDAGYCRRNPNCGE